MDFFGALFLVLAVTLLVGFYLSRPFLSKRYNPSVVQRNTLNADQDEVARSTLLAEKERILAALHDLDFDNSMGKVPVEDYAGQRVELMEEGAAVLRKLDELQPAGVAGSVEDRLEAAIAARRADTRQAGTKPRRPVAANNDDLENMIQERRSQPREKSAGFCPKCGKPAQKSDKFCSRCGATL